MIDLLGFSSHLEISGYDLRTSIGEQAVKRLNNLESVLDSLEVEKRSTPEFHIGELHIQRINDAIFLTMDLNDLLKPSVGVSAFQGAIDISSIVSDDQLESAEKYQEANKVIIQKVTEPLIKFIGLISRIHISINRMEASEFFPGAKTVVSTGFRKPFKKDHFSANFALSNAFQAEHSLHGPNFYMDNSILHILSLNQYAKNLLKFGHFLFKSNSFDCFQDNRVQEDSYIPEPISLKLFRKDYEFRQMNPSPITYLQIVPYLTEYLNGTKSPNLSNIFYKHVFNAIRLGISPSEGSKLKAPLSFLYNGLNDLSVHIAILPEFISTGRSKTRTRLEKEKFDIEHKNLTPTGKKKAKQLMNKKYTLEIEKIPIEGLIPFLYKFNEESVSAFMALVEGDVNKLDYILES